MKNLIAQALRLPGSNTTIQGPIDSNRFPNLASLVTNAIPLIMAIAGAILLAMLIWGGFDYITSFGDPKKAAVARTRITNAILGIVVIFVAYWVVQIVSYIFKLGLYN